jgi:hypothetical protein
MGKVLDFLCYLDSMNHIGAGGNQFSGLVTFFSEAYFKLVESTLIKDLSASIESNLITVN